MMDKKPAEVCHPGEHLRDELKARHWDANTFIKTFVEIYGTDITELIGGDSDITPEIAWKLSDTFGTSAEYWMKLQRAWDERKEG